MNLPNKLTLLRVLFVIPFIAFMSMSYANGGPDFNLITNIGTWSFLISGIIFVVAMMTDWLDGYLARKNNQVTTFGKLFDPLADKIMTTTAMVMLSLMGIVPFYLTLIFILRDVMVDGFRNLAATKKVAIEASIYGKAKTMIQSIGIGVVFFIYPAFIKEFGNFNPFIANYSLYLLNALLFIAAILSIISGAMYFKNIKSHIDTK
ncbi:MAG: CDP-diacylglycerol--glycerol-3-phosphate 3-phosphatidyltransferase [Mycoplasmataceae bacterium]|nr:CDP-diacylglycerol--glycerol-3-phosphate 3-phosphatidyltransferase [Mycoplasmataceae bacterium]